MKESEKRSVKVSIHDYEKVMLMIDNLKLQSDIYYWMMMTYFNLITFGLWLLAQNYPAYKGFLFVGWLACVLLCLFFYFFIQWSESNASQEILQDLISKGEDINGNE